MNLKHFYKICNIGKKYNKFNKLDYILKGHHYSNVIIDDVEYYFTYNYYITQFIVDYKSYRFYYRFKLSDDTKIQLNIICFDILIDTVNETTSFLDIVYYLSQYEFKKMMYNTIKINDDTVEKFKQDFLIQQKQQQIYKKLNKLNTDFE